jgi:hypothetical protein
MPQAYKHPIRIDTILSHSAPLCPILDCEGRMQIDSATKCIKDSGLGRVQCRMCQHRGFRSLEGVHVLYGGRHEHVCGYGPSTHALTIRFSETALSLFLDEYLSPTESALYAANWALLSGQVGGTVNMVNDSPQLSGCYGHFCREYLAHPAHPDHSDCKHDYQLETVGGVYLTGAYVCRLCSFRVGMSHDQFHQHADYPRHYQEGNKTIDAEPAPAERNTTRTKV